MNKPYTCHVDGCAPCTFELVEDHLQEAFDRGQMMYPERIKIQCRGVGSCNQIYVIDIETMTVVE